MKTAAVFPPGEYLKDELHARGWTPTQFAQVIGKPVHVVNQIIKGRKRMTPETAAAIGAAFGTSAEFLWMNLEVAYQLANVKVDPAIARRARSMAR